MSSYLIAIALMVLVVSPLLIPIGVTVVDALANLRTNHRVVKGAPLARHAEAIGHRHADAGDPAYPPSLETLATA
jgi:hypothetical protein